MTKAAYLPIRPSGYKPAPAPYFQELMNAQNLVGIGTAGLLSQVPNMINNSDSLLADTSAQDVINNHLNRDVNSSGAGYVFTPPEQELVNTELPLITPEYQTYDESFVTPDSQVKDQGFVAPDMQLQDEGFITPSSADMTTLYNKGLLEDEVIEDGLLSETAPPFYSKITKTIEDAQMNKASGDGWMGMINNSGVNQDELDWIGMKDFLADKKSVTKEEILDFARMNDLSTEVKEVILGDLSDTINYLESDVLPEVLRHATGYQDAKDIVMNDEGLYNQYQEYVFETKQEFGDDTLDYFLKDELGIVKGSSDQGRTLFNHSNLITEGDYTDYKEMVFQLPIKENEFIQGHYMKYPNTFAHARFNTREIDGKKTLFIEELQSDWIHKGKEEGFKTSKNFKDTGWNVRQLTFDEVNEHTRAGNVNRDKVFGIFDQNNQLVKLPGTIYESTFRVVGDTSQKQINDKIEELKSLALEGQGVVPDIPFKKNWQDIVLKRMIRYAAENGFDAIAMTGGNIQKDRYDLSKQVNEIIAQKSENGIDLTVYDLNNNVVINKNNLSLEEVENLIGKDQAKKIQIDLIENSRKKELRIEGNDLQVGGEGLGQMYDKIFNKSLKKIGKKHGAEVEYLDSLNKDLLNDWSKLEKLYDKINNALVDPDSNKNYSFKPGELSNQTREINEVLNTEEAEIFRRLNKKFQSDTINYIDTNTDGAINKPINDPTNKNIWFMNLTDSLKKQSIEAGMPIAFNKPVNPLLNYA